MKNSLKHVVFSLVCLFFMWVCKTDTTHDNGNGTEPLPASTDVDLVIVNGRMVVKDSEFQKVWAGQPIRFPVEEKGRFVPATIEEWVGTYAIPVTDSGADPDSPYHKQ